jgi:hypothetical protein
MATSAGNRGHIAHSLIWNLIASPIRSAVLASAMSNLRNTIESLASQFASSVLDALRSASIDELADVAGRGSPARRGPGRPRAESNDSSTTAASAPARRGGAGGRGRGGRLGRRTQNDITRMVESIVDILGKNGGGLRSEQIRSALGVEAKELPRPLAEALSSGRVTKTGQKRATTYFAGSGGGAAPKRRGRPVGRKNKKR